MQQLTKPKAQELLKYLQYAKAQMGQLSTKEEYYKQALEKLLVLWEQQERGEGWIEWGGGDCPVERMAIVEVKFTQTPQGEGIAHWWDWHHEEGENNIIAYRIIPERATNQNGGEI